MKASQLIEHLRESVAKHGDQDVFVMNEALEETDVRGVVWCEEEDSNKVVSFLIADENTFDAFYEGSDAEADDEAC